MHLHLLLLFPSPPLSVFLLMLTLFEHFHIFLFYATVVKPESWTAWVVGCARYLSASNLKPIIAPPSLWMPDNLISMWLGMTFLIPWAKGDSQLLQGMRRHKIVSNSCSWLITPFPRVLVPHCSTTCCKECNFTPHKRQLMHACISSTPSAPVVSTRQSLLSRT